MNRNVYLDNNATTMIAPEVVETMMPFFTDLWGNPSSMHRFGGRVRRYVETAREQVAALIGAQPSEIVFTGCGTESDNAALYGALPSAGRQRRLITTRVEHHAVLNPAALLKEKGVDVHELAVDRQGRIDLDELETELRKGPALVSIMWANNETGVLFPIGKIAELVKEHGGIMHTDAVQAAGKLPIDMSRIPADLLSMSGHKLHAPKGVGVLFVRRGTSFAPLLAGGHQESGRRAGTENVPYIAGLGAACEIAAAHMGTDTKRISELRDRLECGLVAACPRTWVNGDTADRLANTSNISFEFIEGEAILYKLSDAGISASSGSACSSGSLEPSHVLRAMGISFTGVHGSIRFSLSRYNTADEIGYALDAVPRIVAELREISPFAENAVP